MIPIAAALRAGAARLRSPDIENPRLEARLLLAHVLGKPQAEILLNQTMTIDTTVFDRLIARRAAREPLAYLLGHREFWSLDFEVSPATLIPRPDTETLVAAALTTWPRLVLDLGTGTGCLLLAVLSERPGAFGIGVDIAPAAAALAARNARRLGLADRTAFLCADWDNALAGEEGTGQFDLVLSNPPYIESAAIDALMPEVARHEPRAALDGGADGNSAYRRIVPVLPRLLAPGGVAILELGAGQGPAVAALAIRSGLASEFRADLAGIQRAIMLRRDS